jgi:hypothetical protein
MTEWIEWTGGECPIPDAKAGEYEIKFDENFTAQPPCNAIQAEFCFGFAFGDIIAYRLIEKKQSDLDWLEGKIEEDLVYWTKRHDPKHEFTKGVKASHKDILHLIKSRKEAKS